MKLAMTTVIAISFLLGVVAPGRAVAQVGPSSGKKSAFVADTFSAVLPSTSPGALAATVDLAKGKKKRNLVIDLTSNYFNNTNDVTLIWEAEINGITPVGQLGESGLCEPSVVAVCEVSMSIWFDLDALEAANPGLIVNKPLSISLRVHDLLGAPSSTFGGVRLAARLEKK